MRKSLLITTIAASISLSACFKSENPLSEVDPTILAKTVIDEKIEVNDCAKLWANLNASSQSLEDNCDSDAFEIAVLFKEKGYGEVSSEQIQLPAIWKSYISLGGVESIHNYDADKARDSMNFLKPRN